jgi:hypothetical protein
VRFDLGMVPLGARVDAARLELATAATSSSGGVRVHRVVGGWTEGAYCTSTFDGATWDTRAE